MRSGPPQKRSGTHDGALAARSEHFGFALRSAARNRASVYTGSCQGPRRGLDNIVLASASSN